MELETVVPMISEEAGEGSRVEVKKENGKKMVWVL